MANSFLDAWVSAVFSGKAADQSVDIDQFGTPSIAHAAAGLLNDVLGIVSAQDALLNENVEKGEGNGASSGGDNG
jgi:hypothetical protein